MVVYERNSGSTIRFLAGSSSTRSVAGPSSIHAYFVGVRHHLLGVLGQPRGYRILIVYGKVWLVGRLQQLQQRWECGGARVRAERLPYCPHIPKRVRGVGHELVERGVGVGRLTIPSGTIGSERVQSSTVEEPGGGLVGRLLVQPWSTAVRNTRNSLRMRWPVAGFTTRRQVSARVSWALGLRSTAELLPASTSSSACCGACAIKCWRDDAKACWCSELQPN